MAEKLINIRELEAAQITGKVPTNGDIEEMLDNPDKPDPFVESVTYPPLEEDKSGAMPFGTYTPKVSKLIGYKIMLYGGPGTGKTWMASTFPDPLFLDLEGGMQPVAFRNPLRYPKDPSKMVTTVAEIGAFHNLAKAYLDKPNCPFQTIVIDGLNELQKIVLDHVVSKYRGSGRIPDANDKKQDRLYDDQPNQSDYGKANRDVLKIFRMFWRLPCNIVFLAVSSPRTYEDEQVYPRFVGKEVGPEIMRIISAIGYTYTVMSEDIEEEIKYYVSFANTPTHIAKDRLGIGPKPRPNDFKYLWSAKGK